MFSLCWHKVQLACSSTHRLGVGQTLQTVAAVARFSGGGGLAGTLLQMLIHSSAQAVVAALYGSWMSICLQGNTTNKTERTAESVGVQSWHKACPNLVISETILKMT